MQKKLKEFPTLNTSVKFNSGWNKSDYDLSLEGLY